MATVLKPKPGSRDTSMSSPKKPLIARQMNSEYSRGILKNSRHDDNQTVIGIMREASNMEEFLDTQQLMDKRRVSFASHARVRLYDQIANSSASSSPKSNQSIESEQDMEFSYLEDQHSNYQERNDNETSDLSDVQQNMEFTERLGPQELNTVYSGDTMDFIQTYNDYGNESLMNDDTVAMDFTSAIQPHYYAQNNTHISDGANEATDMETTKLVNIGNTHSLNHAPIDMETTQLINVQNYKSSPSITNTDMDFTQPVNLDTSARRSVDQESGMELTQLINVPQWPEVSTPPQKAFNKNLLGGSSKSPKGPRPSPATTRKTKIASPSSISKQVSSPRRIEHVNVEPLQFGNPSTSPIINQETQYSTIKDPSLPLPSVKSVNSQTNVNKESPKNSPITPRKDMFSKQDIYNSRTRPNRSSPLKKDITSELLRKSSSPPPPLMYIPNMRKPSDTPENNSTQNLLELTKVVPSASKLNLVPDVLSTKKSDRSTRSSYNDRDSANLTNVTSSLSYIVPGNTSNLEEINSPMKKIADVNQNTQKTGSPRILLDSNNVNLRSPKNSESSMQKNRRNTLERMENISQRVKENMSPERYVDVKRRKTVGNFGSTQNDLESKKINNKSQIDFSAREREIRKKIADLTPRRSSVKRQKDNTNSINGRSQIDVLTTPSRLPKAIEIKSSLSKFLEMTNITFLDHLFETQKLKGTLEPPKDLMPPTEEDFIVATAGTIPELELLEFSCNELTKYISEGREVIQKIEDKTSKDTPSIFQAYSGANLETQKRMQVQFKQIKALTRAQARMVWYEWRKKLLESLLSHYDKQLIEYSSDEQYYNDNFERLQKTLSIESEMEGHLLNRLEFLENQKSQRERWTGNDQHEELNALHSLEEEIESLQLTIKESVESAMNSAEEIRQLQSKKNDLSAIVQKHQLRAAELKNIHPSVFHEIRVKSRLLESLFDVKMNYYSKRNIKIDISPYYIVNIKDSELQIQLSSIGEASATSCKSVIKGIKNYLDNLLFNGQLTSQQLIHKLLSLTLFMKTAFDELRVVTSKYETIVSHDLDDVSFLNLNVIVPNSQNTQSKLQIKLPINFLSKCSEGFTLQNIQVLPYKNREPLQMAGISSLQDQLRCNGFRVLDDIYFQKF